MRNGTSLETAALRGCLGSASTALTRGYRLGLLCVIFDIAFGIGNIFTSVIIWGIISMSVLRLYSSWLVIADSEQSVRRGPDICGDSFPSAHMPD